MENNSTQETGSVPLLLLVHRAKTNRKLTKKRIIIEANELENLISGSLVRYSGNSSHL